MGKFVQISQGAFDRLEALEAVDLNVHKSPMWAAWSARAYHHLPRLVELSDEKTKELIHGPFGRLLSFWWTELVHVSGVLHNLDLDGAGADVGRQVAGHVEGRAPPCASRS